MDLKKNTFAKKKKHFSFYRGHIAYSRRIESEFTKAKCFGKDKKEMHVF